METIGIIIAIFYLFLGVIIGSFLNVVSLRYDTGSSVLGRSRCINCKNELKWFELIPVFSFIFQLGKCRNCESKISIQYILIESFTGIVFLGIFLKFSDLISVSISQFTAMSVYFMAIFSILIVIFVYDMKHKIIPDGLVYSFIFLSFFAFWILNFRHWNLLGVWSLEFGIWISAGPLLFLPFFLLWFVSGGRWIGLGDGKLALGIGWLLGLSLGASAIILSFWMGALVGIFLITIPLLNLSKKGFTMKSEVPFGPFLIVGLLLVFFFNINILQFLM